MKQLHQIWIALLLLVSLTAQAQGLSENQRLLGYIQTDSITVKDGAFGEAGTYSIGAVLTPRILSAYAGCKVVGLRMAASLDLGRARTFIYNIEASGQLTAVVEQRQRLYNGWNNVFFNGDGYVIQGNESLFFGFDYTETAEMVSAEQGGLCGYGQDTDDGFYLYGNYGQGMGLYSISGVGCLCVQLIVDVSSLPAKDLDLLDIDAGFKYKQPGEDVDVLVALANVGREQIASYKLGYQLDGQQPVYTDFTSSLRSGQEDAWLFSFALPKDVAIGQHVLKVFVADVEGKSIHEKSKNDTVKATFAVYHDKLSRSKVYMEIYSDQTSPYVPWLDDGVKLLTSSNSALAVVNVQRPGMPLAVPEAAYLHDLYAYSWPTFTVNRSYFPGEANIAYDMNDYLPVIGAEMTAGIIGDMLYQDLLSPAFASIDLKADLDAASRQLSVVATGQLLPEASAIYGDLALTLMVVEDSVTAVQYYYDTVKNRTAANSKYLHNHVLRGFMTAPVGDVIESAENSYSMSRTLTLNSAWNADHISVVALLTKQADKVTEENVLDVDVINCNTARPQLTSGIHAVKATTGSLRYFTLDGKAVEHPAHGIYLQRNADGTVRKVAVK